jgi:hypothetical protein
VNSEWHRTKTTLKYIDVESLRKRKGFISTVTQKLPGYYFPLVVGIVLIEAVILYWP